MDKYQQVVHAGTGSDKALDAPLVQKEQTPEVAHEHVLGRLPPELLVEVLEHLSIADLCACLRVNTVVCSLALPLLYRHVRLGETRSWPAFDNGSCTVGPYKPGTRPAFLSRAVLVKHIRRLDISAHETTVCESSGLLHWWHGLPPLPNLQVVRVSLTPNWSGNRVFHTNVEAHNPDRQPHRNCAALTHLRTRKLVVRRLTLAHNTVPRHELPARFEDHVRHFVTVLQPDHPYFLPRNADRMAQHLGGLFRSRIPHLTTRLTMVFWAPGRSSAWRAGPGNHTLSWELIWAHATSLFSNLAAWMTQRQPYLVELINVGALQRIDDGKEMSDDVTRGMHGTVRQIFRTAVEERFGDEETRERIMGSLRLLTMEEWLAKDEWEDILDEDEVLPFLSEDAASRKSHTPKRSSKELDESTPPTPPLGSPVPQHLPLFQLTVSES